MLKFAFRKLVWDKKGLYIDYVEIDEKDKWVEYYRKNSDRYPEVE